MNYLNWFMIAALIICVIVIIWLLATRNKSTNNTGGTDTNKGSMGNWSGSSKNKNN